MFICFRGSTAGVLVLSWVQSTIHQLSTCAIDQHERECGGTTQLRPGPATRSQTPNNWNPVHLGLRDASATSSLHKVLDPKRSKPKQRVRVPTHSHFPRLPGPYRSPRPSPDPLSHTHEIISYTLCRLPSAGLLGWPRMSAWQALTNDPTNPSTAPAPWAQPSLVHHCNHPHTLQTTTNNTLTREASGFMSVVERGSGWKSQHQRTHRRNPSSLRMSIEEGDLMMSMAMWV